MGTRTYSRGAGRRGNYQTVGEVDVVAVQRAIDGRDQRLYPHEIREAVRRLNRVKLTVREIAERLGVCDRTVSRHLAALETED